MSQRLRSVLLVLSILGAACGGGSSSPSGPSNPPPPSPPPNDPGSPASLQIISGNGQTATVDNALSAPLVAAVLNAQGVAITSTTVSWVVTGGGGSVFSPATSTNQSGQTQNIWTLGTIAGNQTVEVRWVNSTTGAAVVIGNFVAKADPGNPVSLSLETPSTAILSILETAQAFVIGEDEFGNAISSGQIQLTWTSTDASVTTVDASGLMTGVGGGTATVQASAGSVSTQIGTAVNDAPTVIHSSPNLGKITGGGGRLLGSSVGEIFNFTNGIWQPEFSPGADFAGISLVVSSTGEAWAAKRSNTINGEDLVWVSDLPTSWAVDLISPPVGRVLNELSLSNVLDGQLVFSAAQVDSVPRNSGGSFDYFQAPRVFVRDLSGSWNNLNHPPTGGDGFFQARRPLFVGADDIYVCLVSQELQFGGGFTAHVSHWDGSTWSLISHPDFIPLTSIIVCESIDRASGIGYAVLFETFGSSSIGAVQVMALAGGAATVVPDLPQEDFAALSQVHVGNASRLYLAYDVPLGGNSLITTFQWQTGTGQWRKYWMPDGWKLAGRAWVDPNNGTLWAPAFRETNNASSTFEISTD